MVRRERIDVTGQSHETTQEAEAKWKSPLSPNDPAHCQEIVTKGVMSGLHLQSLQWTDDGELSAEDRWSLLTSLLPNALPEVQVELIALLERSTTDQALLTPEVSVS